MNKTNRFLKIAIAVSLFFSHGVIAQNADGYTHLTWDKESTDQKIGTANWDVMHGDVLYFSPRLVDNGVGRPWPAGATFRMNYATPSMVYSNLWWTNLNCAVSATETGRVHALWGGTALDYYDGNMAYICRLGAWAGTTNIGHTIWWTMNMKASPGWAAGTAPVPSNLASNYVTRAELLAVSNYLAGLSANAVTNGGATITVDGVPYAISNGAVVAITSGSGGGVSGTTCSNITAGIISTGVYVIATNALDIANAAVPKADTNGWTVSSHSTFLTPVNTQGMATVAQVDARTNALDIATAARDVQKTQTNGWEVGSHAGLATGAQLSAATNAAIVDATSRVALVGYLLPVSTQQLVTATQLATATNGAVQAATNLSQISLSAYSNAVSNAVALAKSSVQTNRTITINGGVGTLDSNLVFTIAGGALTPESIGAAQGVTNGGAFINGNAISNGAVITITGSGGPSYLETTNIANAAVAGYSNCVSNAVSLAKSAIQPSGSGALLTGITPAQIGAASNTLAGMASAGALTGAVLTVGTGLPTWSYGLLSIPTNNFGGGGGGSDPNAITNAQINSGPRGSVTNKVAFLPVDVDPFLSYMCSNPASITANGTYLPWTSVLTPAPSAGTNLIVAANGQQPLLNCTGACVIGVDPNGGWGAAGINRFSLALWTTNWSVTVQSNAYIRWAAPLNLSVSRTNHLSFRGNGTNNWTIYPL